MKDEAVVLLDSTGAYSRWQRGSCPRVERRTSLRRKGTGGLAKKAARRDQTRGTRAGVVMAHEGGCGVVWLQRLGGGGGGKTWSSVDDSGGLPVCGIKAEGGQATQRRRGVRAEPV